MLVLTIFLFFFKTSRALILEQIWSKVVRNGTFALEHVKRMNHLDQAGFNIGAAMTCVLPMAHTVYIGDEDGRVVSYLLAPIISLRG